MKHLTRLLPIIPLIALPLFFASPAAGEFNADALISQVNNHEQRITDLEHKTDATQTQVDQASADVQALQQSTAPAPAVEPAVAPVAAPATSPTVQAEAAPTPAPEPEAHETIIYAK